MPDLLIEVLSLEAQLLPGALGWSGNTADEAGVIFCQLAPAWESDGLCLSTDDEKPDINGHLLWQRGHTVWHEDSEEVECPEPLVALLVTVSPPGGIMQVVSQRLSITMFHTIRGSLLFDDNVEVPLRRLQSAQEGQPVRLNAHTKDGLVNVAVVVAWLQSPPCMRELFGEPSRTPSQQGAAARSPSPVPAPVPTGRWPPCPERHAAGGAADAHRAEQRCASAGRGQSMAPSNVDDPAQCTQRPRPRPGTAGGTALADRAAARQAISIAQAPVWPEDVGVADIRAGGARRNGGQVGPPRHVQERIKQRRAKSCGSSVRNSGSPRYVGGCWLRPDANQCGATPMAHLGSAEHDLPFAQPTVL